MTMNKDKKFTRLDQRIIEVLPTSKSIMQASRNIGCAPKTIYRALEKPHIQEELAKREQDVTSTIKEAFTSGIDRLEAIINDPDSTKSEIMKAFREVRKMMEFMALKLERDTRYEEMSDQELQRHYEELEESLREYEQECPKLP